MHTSFIAIMVFSLISLNKTFVHGFKSCRNHITTQIRTKLNARPKKISNEYTSTSSSKKNMSPLYKPRTENQIQYVKYLNDNNIPIVLGIGPAGSGKTLFACNQAVSALKNGAVSKIILTRPVVSVEEDIGFLPGNLMNKMDPWTRPIFDILLEYYQQKEIDGMIHGGVLEISPLGYMRGRTFKNAFIIADEMQNSSPNQMLMLTTRIGEGSKMVITGDLKQSDRCTDNGLADLMQKVKKYNEFCDFSKLTLPNIRTIEMKSVDIQRSAIVSKLLDIYSDKPRTVPSTKTISNSNDTNNETSSYTDAALLPLNHYQQYSKYLLD